MLVANTMLNVDKLTFLCRVTYCRSIFVILQVSSLSMCIWMPLVKDRMLPIRIFSRNATRSFSSPIDLNNS